MTNGCDISSEIALRWTSLDLKDDKSTLVHVMAWCLTAPSHYLNQCWPRSLPLYVVTRPQWVNSLAHGRCGSNFKSIIFTLIFQIDIMSTSRGPALTWLWMPPIDEKSILVQVMARRRKATSHYLSQHLPRPVSTYSVTRPQCVIECEWRRYASLT